MARKHCRHRITFATIFFQPRRCLGFETSADPFVHRFPFLICLATYKQQTNAAYCVCVLAHLTMFNTIKSVQCYWSRTVIWHNENIFWTSLCVQMCVHGWFCQAIAENDSDLFNVIESYERNIWYIRMNIFLLGPRPSKMWLLIMIVEWIINRMIF